MDIEDNNPSLANDYGSFAIIPVDVLESDLSDGAKVLYAMLWSYSRGARRVAFPSRSTIAAKLHTSERTIVRRLGELVDAGFISRRDRYRGDGGQTSSEYTILPPGHRCHPPRDTDVTPPVTPVSPLEEELLEEEKEEEESYLPRQKFQKKLTSETELRADDLQINDELRGWAERFCPLVLVDVETEKWKNHSSANNRVFSSEAALAAAWKNWMGNAQTFIKSRVVIQRNAGPSGHRSRNLTAEEAQRQLAAVMAERKRGTSSEDDRR